MPTMLDQDQELEPRFYRAHDRLTAEDAQQLRDAHVQRSPRVPWPFVGVLAALVGGFVLLIVWGGPPIEAPLPVPTATTSTVAGFTGNGNCDQACQAWFAEQRAKTGATAMSDTAPEDIPERELSDDELAVHDAARALTARGFVVEQDDAGTITATHANGARVVVKGGAAG